MESELVSRLFQAAGKRSIQGVSTVSHGRNTGERALDRKDDDFLALEEYISQKATLLDRLANMEAKRDRIKHAIFDKIKADYEGQLRTIIDEFRPIRIRIVKKLSEFDTELAQIEKKLIFAKDKVIELRFRHDLGEYSEDEFRRIEYDYLAQVDQIQAGWDDLNSNIESYRSLIGDDREFQRRIRFEEASFPSAPAMAYDPEHKELEEDLAVELFPPEMLDEGDATAASVAGEPEPAPFPGPTATADIATAAATPPLLLEPKYTNGESGSAIPEMATPRITPAIEFKEPPSPMSPEDSSTGVWTGDELENVGMPGDFGDLPATTIDWTEAEEERDSTMVWGETPTLTEPEPPAKVLVFSDDKSGEVSYPIGPGEVSIGRSQDNDIVLTEGKISRRHAKVVFEEGSFFLVDLGSSNGTYVNGKRVTRVMLQEEDEILIGESMMSFR